MTFSVTQIQFQSRRAVCHYGELRDADNVILSWIYDCGKKAFVKKIPNNRDLDFIFVSHFDADHVNSICDLKIGKNTQIYIPYVPKSLFFILIILHSKRYSAKGLSFIYSVYIGLRNQWDERYIDDDIDLPEDFFENLIFKRELFYVNNISVVSSGNFQISLNAFVPWEFFVSSYIDPSFMMAVSQLAKNICSSGMPLKYWLGQNLDNLKKHYKNINYGALSCDVNNIISMCVYAGPTNNSIKANDNNILKNTGWLHTGDSCFHLPNVLSYFLKVFKIYGPRTYVLSLPHHGSKKTNTTAVLSSLRSNFRQATFVIPYSTTVKHCCHRNYIYQCVYCTENQDVSFINGRTNATQTAFPCSKRKCKIF